MKIKISDAWKYFFSTILAVSIFSSLSNVRRLDGFVIAEPLLNIGVLKNIFPMAGLAIILLLISKSFSKLKVEAVERNLFFILMFFSLTPILSTLFGITQDIDFRILLYPACVFLVFKYRAPDKSELIDFVYKILTIYIIINYIVLLLTPFWALQHGYTIGWINGLTVRLYGVSGHPNNISSILLLYIFFSVFNFRISTRQKFLSIILATCLIVLAQSKTILLILLLTTLYLLFLKFENKLSKNLKALYKGILVLASLSLISLILGSIGNAENYLVDLLGQARFNRLTTLTGRDVIWGITIEQFLENPIFGYGPGLYEQKSLFMTRLGFTPGHAHNQFFQTMGETGLLGLIFLVSYLAALYRLIFSYLKNNILIKVIFVVLLFRMMTQSVFRGGFDEVFLFQMVFLLLLRCLVKEKIINEDTKYP